MSNEKKRTSNANLDHEVDGADGFWMMPPAFILVAAVTVRIELSAGLPLPGHGPEPDDEACFMIRERCVLAFVSEHTNTSTAVGFREKDLLGQSHELILVVVMLDGQHQGSVRDTLVISGAGEANFHVRCALVLSQHACELLSNSRDLLMELHALWRPWTTGQASWTARIRRLFVGS